jgi:hypothetical protein
MGIGGGDAEVGCELFALQFGIAELQQLGRGLLAL